MDYINKNEIFNKNHTILYKSFIFVLECIELNIGSTKLITESVYAMDFKIWQSQDLIQNNACTVRYQRRK